MSTYQIVQMLLAFLAGCGLTAWFVPWLIDRDAIAQGFWLGWVAHRDAAENEDAFTPPVDLAERMKQFERSDPDRPRWEYAHQVDPPGAYYPR